MVTSVLDRAALSLPRSTLLHSLAIPARKHSEPTKRSRRQSAVCAWGKKASQSNIKTVPVTQNRPSGGVPIALKFGAALVMVAAAVKLINKMRNRGSTFDLEDRGFIAEGGQTTSSKDPFYNDMMKNYNTVQYQELSSDQIAAARQRRSQDRRNDEKVDLSKIQLPANHPFAVSKQLSDEEERLQLARLNVRRGMPIKDPKEADVRRGIQDMPERTRTRQLPAESERRDAALQRRSHGGVK